MHEIFSGVVCVDNNETTMSYRVDQTIHGSLECSGEGKTVTKNSDSAQSTLQ